MSADHATLRRRIHAVSDAEADDDRLLTLGVAADESVGAVRERVEEERAKAEYIEEDNTDQHRRDAFERAVRVLRNYEQTPEHGLVLYVGVVDGDVEDYVFDDVSGLAVETAYSFDNEFDVEPLEAAVAPQQTFGLVVVERGGAALGRLDGGRVTDAEQFESEVPGKTRAGGQSAERFERERERAKEEFFERVGEAASRRFLDASSGGGDSESTADPNDGAATPSVDGVLVGGTAVTADQFCDGDYVDSRLDDAVLGDPIPVEYATEQGLSTLAERGADRLEELERRAPEAALEAFFEALSDEAAENEVRYGDDGVGEALEYDAVETVLVSEAVEVERLRAFEERTTEQGGELTVVPVDVERGEQFVEAFEGVGAFLRFPLE
ncbi:Vms1/Ankzf1 family peptidyl-tRNA hydrolase [Halogeometricum limi]|uniref:Peptide chain release factor subunit 1 n=1 Tax=Halogeometricum limi TaxID=555875 RepID=A0A1I6IA92_9EURY|nr:Vms1/Ankzf1 family peptidyl-tRNA hydrolase [Halogeometricum limi]SFR63554.1 peptide chain release factor subunit 1 [Halogeometricum limi]